MTAIGVISSMGFYKSPTTVMAHYNPALYSRLVAF
jgi:hypothetical protein